MSPGAFFVASDGRFATMALADPAEEEPEANRVAGALNRQHRVQVKVLLTHVLTQLVHVPLNR
jgi:hypothetical protein